MGEVVVGQGRHRACVLARWASLWARVAMVFAGAAASAPARQIDSPGVAARGGTEVSPDDWSAIRQARDARRHRARPCAEGFRFVNPGQRWRTTCDSRGFTVEPDDGGWSWGLELEQVGLLGHEQPVKPTSAPRLRAEGARVVREWSDALEEWLVNDGRGLEHGFTVLRPPTRPTEESRLVLRLRVRGSWVLEVEENGRDVRFLDAFGRAAVTYSGLTVFDADGTTQRAWFEASRGGLSLFVETGGARYPLTIDPVAQQAYLKASNTGAGDSFGQSVAVSGDTVVVGAFGEDSLATGVNGDDTDDSSDESGAAYVFVRQGSSWTQEAYLKASNTDDDDRFGGAVSISGDTIVVGASAEDGGATGVNGDDSLDSVNSSGAAYVFVRSGSSWTQQAYLKGSTIDAGDDFGRSVSISGDTLVIGATGEDSDATGVDGNEANDSLGQAGAAYVFVRSGATWMQQAYLKASNTDAADQFGYSVAVSGDTVVVGANREESAATGVDGDELDDNAPTSGAAYVFVRDGMTWSQQAYLKASNTDGGDNFGVSVAVSGDLVVVGAQGEDSGATGVDGDEDDDLSPQAGAAYVFVRDGMAWSQQAYLKASNTDGGDVFGNSVAISGERVLVGAREEDSSSSGVDGDGGNDGLMRSGAAYVFERQRDGTTWIQEAYLKASTPHVFDAFGWSVATSGDNAVVGANLEGGGASGVNGDEADQTASGAGAAYLFRLGDCDGDGTPDALEVDVNGDGTPDECQPQAFCFGLVCPCGNDDPGAGCLHSGGQGAHLRAPSSFAAGSGALSIDLVDAPPNNLALVLVADVLQTPLDLADGRMCLAGASTFAYRYVPGLTSAGGQLALEDATVGPPARSFAAGRTYFFQAWYRDVFCTPLPVPCVSPCGSASNFTNVAAVVVVP